MTGPGPDFAFLDVATLLESSRPRGRWSGMRLLIAGCAAALLLSWFLLGQTPGTQQLFSVSLSVLLGVFVAGWALNGFLAVREARAQQRQLQIIEELIQLRRWPQAAFSVQAFLSRPARSPATRAQAMLFLAMVLARYHRFDDSVAVHEHILEEVLLDDEAVHSVQVGRAMALLRAENLLDADRAIADLRRQARAAGGIGESPGLALVEIYRDVKTGHPAEAIQMFQSRLAVMRRDLGHRLADAWALAARAYDMLGQSPQAEQAYRNATLLLPLVELRRRYPEIAPLADRLAPAAAPAEVA
ncbi:MAG: hypothetical protein ABR964_05190 [Tepidisphaeraceae bacterium]|jgi:tetratricopeptide (TPR) repeat protein